MGPFIEVLKAMAFHPVDVLLEQVVEVFGDRTLLIRCCF
jgi:hypothetical protein